MNYDQTHILHKCEDIILEAKRVLLNEELDSITNDTLSGVEQSRKNIEHCFQQCKDSSNWKNDLFWKELPKLKNPSKEINHTINKNQNEELVTQNNLIIGDGVNISKHQMFTCDCPDSKVHRNYLTKKYFNIWKKTVQNRNERVKLLENKLDTNIKLDKFIKKIKKRKKHDSINNPKDEKSKEIAKPIKPPNNFKNRFIAQKSIIDSQKVKLQEQNTIIEELRLGIIREDLLKSLENTKINIQEIFRNCSEKVKCKIPVLLPEENKKFTITTQKYPKIVQQMEQRALQRAQNRQIILERKRLIEEARQKMLEEAIEKKRTIEEQERKKNLELIKERRKNELELERIRQAQKQKYLKSLNKAVDCYNKLLIRSCFRVWLKNYVICKENDVIARNYYKTNMLQKSISCWSAFVEEKYKVKYIIADEHFAYKLLKKAVNMWHDFHVECVRNMQVAEDIYDFHLTSHTFVHWHRYVCSQIILQDKRMKIAENHFKRKLLFQYYYQWRSLPAVIQLEKAKELKKQKWREKVWEVLPDYKPPEDV